MNGNYNKRYVDNSISSSNELKESKYENPSNTATDSFFKAYVVCDIEKLSQTKRKYSNTSNSINELPNKRRCKAEKFEAIQYSLGPNEEYFAIRSYEYDIWERKEDNMSKIYQDTFQKKDEGWKLEICTLKMGMYISSQSSCDFTTITINVPPPYTENFMPPTPDLSFTGLDEIVNERVPENCKAMSSEEEPKVVRKNDDAPIIEE
ncbi:hypothetical protein Tco_0653560 [Tanacetum coccineum]|uniref:Uncharacterized protein n=1 Tax=Tanacetum coccineum TaxID=301880 RepID=A0ABQ4X0R6_9ASTR